MAIKERVALWADALDSGEFERGQGALEIIKKDGTKSHCCMGVACRIAMKNGLELHTETRFANSVEMTWFSAGSTFNAGSSTFLPQAVRDWYDFDTIDPVVGYDRYQISVSAANANDDRDWDFHKIAEGLREMYVRENEEN